jgi:hypothetical protein
VTRDAGSPTNPMRAAGWILFGLAALYAAWIALQDARFARQALQREAPPSENTQTR